MNDTRRKLLTKALGEKWHEKVWEGDYLKCSCGLILHHKEDFEFALHIKKANRTFLTADDWELVLEKVVRPNSLEFISHVYKNWCEPVWDDDFDNMTCFMEWFLTLSIGERCKLIHDFGMEVLKWQNR